MTTENSSVTLSQEVTTFTDTVSVDTPYLMTEYTESDRIDVGTLANFLKRPIRIDSTTWNEASPVSVLQTLDPWTLFLDTPIIKNKLNNYAWFKGTLHVKFVINASPFYYGMMMVSYNPMHAFNAAYEGPTDSNTLVLRSQRPHILLNPANSQGAQIMLPFLYPAHYCPLGSSTEIAALGRLTYDIVAPLDSANGVSGTGITVQTYAWMEDVDIQGPTLGLAMQSGEYTNTGAVSSVASAVAGIADKLTKVPVLGRFATATSIGAKAIGSIASIFGFSNTPVLESARPMRDLPLPPLASTEIGYPLEKLTIDPKNELAVDAAPMGVNLPDELDISHFVQRSSYLQSFPISTADAVDKQLYRMAITPQFVRRTSSTNHYRCYHTPMAYIAQLFTQWRGDIVVRFDFVKTQYHRGRVIIAWEPILQTTNNIVQNTNPVGAAITKIVDLGTEDSVEITIPYNSNTPWLRCQTRPNVYTVVGGSDTFPSEYIQNVHNGVLTVRLQNELTAPVADSTIQTIVSVKGAPNLEFANYRGIELGYSPFVLQSGEYNLTPALEEDMGCKSNTDNTLHLTTMGERIVSLRQIMRRYTLNEVWVEPTISSSQLAYITHFNTKYPVSYGFDPSGIQLANKANTAGTAAFNFVTTHPSSWISMCFLGVRGSMNWSFNVSNISEGKAVNNIARVTRFSTLSPPGTKRLTAAQTTKTGAGDARFFLVASRNTTAGTSITNTGNNTCVNVAIPDYNYTLFRSTKPEYALAPTSSGGGVSEDRDWMALEVPLFPSNGQTTTSMLIEKYVGIGMDYSLFHFISVPVVYVYDNTPTAA
jgi:hypothetical protein